MMQQEEMYVFHTGHAMSLVGGVDRTTIYRWLREGKINGVKSDGGYWWFSLDEINRIRVNRVVDGRFLLPLSNEEAMEFWESN
jgi:hypothetical protein